ncbi:MAG: choice-of-anchor tandem repeat NxxGxxAF-containing protein [Phormidesmis sp.]
MFAIKGIQLLITTGLSVAALSSGNAQAFTFTEIANTNTSDFTDFQATAINDLGEVAFTAEAAGQLGIFQGDGGAITPLFPSSLGLNTVEGIDFNSAGVVAFTENSTPGVFTSDGTVSTLIINPDTALGQIGFLPDAFSAPDINESGAIAVVANNFGSGEQALYLTEAGVGSTIAEAPEFDIFRFSLNNNNEVTFFAISGAAPDGDAIFLSEDGGAPTPLPDPLGFGTIEGPTLNDGGTVAYDTLFVNDEGAAVQGIFIQNGEEVTLKADITGDFNSLDRPAINNAGELVFLAQLETGESGLFSGSDPVGDRIIATGDDLFGATVTGLDFTQQTGLNNSGQLTFNASFADGSIGVYRADPEEGNPQPVPEPTAVLTTLVVGIVGLASQQRSRNPRA